jgi:hypothetical protein
MKQLFNTKEERQQATAKFVDLLNNPGWQLVCDILDANIEIIKQTILDGVDGETKETIDRLRDRLKTYQSLRETPEKMIEALSNEGEYQPNLDPFERVDKKT